MCDPQTKAKFQQLIDEELANTPLPKGVTLLQTCYESLSEYARNNTSNYSQTAFAKLVDSLFAGKDFGIVTECANTAHEYLLQCSTTAEATLQLLVLLSDLLTNLGESLRYGVAAGQVARNEITKIANAYNVEG